MIKYKLEIYEDADNPPRWRWRFTARNGEIIGASSQSFHSKREADANLERMWEALSERTRND